MVKRREALLLFAPIMVLAAFALSRHAAQTPAVVVVAPAPTRPALDGVTQRPSDDVDIDLGGLSTATDRPAPIALANALRRFPKSSKFTMRWQVFGINIQGSGAILYNRAAHTLDLRTFSLGHGKGSEHLLYFGITDALLFRFGKPNGYEGTSSDGGFAELENFGLQRKKLPVNEHLNEHL